MKRKILATISLILTCVMVIMSLPLEAMAYYLSQNASETEVAENEVSENTSLDLESLSIEYEDKSKRNINEKHFKLSDGSFIAIQYDEPVHYYDDTDGWIDIDNTLNYDTSTDFDGYANDANSFEVKFADNTTNDILYSITDKSGNNKLSFELIDATTESEAIVLENASTMNLTAEGSEDEFLADIMPSESLTSDILYENVYENVDIHYSVTPTGVKENIMVYERLNKYEFSFNINADGMTLMLNSDGGVDVMSDGKIAYTIPAPFMFDDNGRTSDAVQYVLTNNTNGTYTLKIVANKEWVNSDDTVFPVTIDPIISAAPSYKNTISNTCVLSSAPDTNFSTNIENKVGLISEGNLGRMFFNINYFPTIYDCDVITSAELRCFVGLHSRNSSISYELHKVNTAWETSSITWNNQPEYESDIIDTTYLNSRNDINEFAKWDITAPIKDYYKTGVKHSYALVSSDETTVGHSVILGNTAAASLRSYIIVRYRCQLGIEDSYTYTSYDDGAGGTAHINNYTGTVTYIKNLFTSQSDIMPAKVDIVYNSALYNKRFTSNELYVNTCLYSGMSISEGWKLSVQESIVPVSIMETQLNTDEWQFAYIYNDEDGTEHYFYLDTENETEIVYIDQLGLGMELRVDETNKQYTIKTPHGTTKTFKILSEKRWGETYNNGYIISETDEEENSIIYTYDTSTKSKLLSITDPSGTVITINYSDSNGMISGISAGDKYYTIEYYPGFNNWATTLYRVTDETGIRTTFNYTSTFSGPLTSVDPDGANELSFEYFEYVYSNNEQSSYKIASASYRTGTRGGEIKDIYTSNVGYATTVHNIGTDCTADTEDDIYITYTFDKAGNTKLMYAENNTRDIVYATNMYGYSNGNTMNVTASDYKLTSYASTGIIGTNLIADSNAENGILTMSRYGDSSTIAKVSNFKYAGNKSFISTNNSTNDFGMSTTQTIPAGKYTFSAHVKSVTANTITGHYLKVLDANGNVVSESPHVGSTNETLNGGWVRLHVDFEAETSGAYTLVIVAKGTGSNAFVADALQLEVDTGYTPSAYNMLENSGFESGMANWTASSSSNVALNTDSKFGENGVTINGNFGTEYTVLQTVPVNCIPENSYIISGWAKANAVSTETSDKKFDLIAKVKYEYTDAEGATRTEYHTTYVPFTWETREWQYVSGVVEMPELDEGKTLTNIIEISVGACYNNCNTAKFDNIALVQDSALLIKYDNDGNIVNFAIDNNSEYRYAYDENTGYVSHVYYKDGGLYRRYEYYENGNLQYEYDENDTLYREYFYNESDNITHINDGNGNQYRRYEYYDSGELKNLYDENNTVIENYTYTDGKLTSSVVDGTTSNYGYTAWGTQCSNSVSVVIDQVTKTMSSSSTYDPITKKVISETDSLGNTVTYGYDANLWLNLIEDANGNQTRYEYNGNNLSCQYIDTDKDGTIDEGEAIVSFAYDQYGKLTGITTATTTYVITYNNANLPLSVGISGEETPLITYLYNDKKTVNTGYTYANGLTITYEYDNIGNVERVLKNGTPIYSCELDADMQLTCEQDYMADSETQYFYTAAGELYLTYETLGDNVILSYTITDDETGKSDYITEINGTKLTYSSVYDEETEISKYILPNLEEITSDTDDFGRTKNVYLKDSEGNTLLSYTYTYVDKTVDGTVRTSEYVASITYSNGKAFSYTYDPNGNITSVSDGTYTTSYVYDNLGQLTRENSQKLNKTWTYSYDTSGNILSKSEYAYTVGELGTAASTITYGYTDSNWGDQLTSYNGTAITYDSLGNPLNWTNGKTFTWEGRQLKSVSNGTYVYTYEYNADGIRTKTTVTKPADPDYSEVYEYILDDNGNVVQIKLNGSVHATFYYDETGSPIGYTSGQYTFRFIKNLQGDIIRIESVDGSMYADYVYDAWGNATAEYSNLVAAFAIAKYNIFTYRGYIYDTQTGFYYLQSRYYDPAVGRFLNADAVDYLGASGTVLGYNLYSYCENDAVNYIDYYGFDRIAILYDNRSSGFFGLNGKGFNKQGKYWVNALKKAGHSVSSYGFSSIGNFCNKWNSLSGDYDTIIIMAHGSAGSLDCNGERLLVDNLYDSMYKVYRASKLKSVSAKYVYLFSCNGGTKKYIRPRVYSQTVAQLFAFKTRGEVFAVKDGKLDIDYFTGTVSKSGGIWTSTKYFNNGIWSNYSIKSYKLTNFSPTTLF